MLRQEPRYKLLNLCHSYKSSSQNLQGAQALEAILYINPSDEAAK